MKLINSEFEQMKFDIIDPGVKINYLPDEQGMAACYELGKKITEALPAE